MCVQVITQQRVQSLLIFKDDLISIKNNKDLLAYASSMTMNNGMSCLKTLNLPMTNQQIFKVNVNQIVHLSMTSENNLNNINLNNSVNPLENKTDGKLRVVAQD